MRCTGRPRAPTADSQRACHAASLGAAAAASVRSSVKLTPRRSQISARRARTSASSASRAASVVARRSRLNSAAARDHVDGPAGHLAACPTVPTDLAGTAPARSSTWRINSATAAAASRRRSIGVVPAWRGEPAHLAHVADAAVDRGDDAQRQVELIEHGPLFDVHLDETEVARRIPLQAWIGAIVPGRPASRIRSRSTTPSASA